MTISQISRQVLYGCALFILLFSCKSQEEAIAISPDPDATFVNEPSEIIVESDSLISGTLIDTDGSPIAGAKIQIVDTENIALSDINGLWSIDVSGTQYSALMISLEGYRSKTMSPPVGSNTVIVMKEGSGGDDDGRIMMAADMSATSRGTISESAEIAVSAKAEMSAPASRASKSRPSPERVRPGAPSQPEAKSGLLTAGEWNDLYNWDDWQELLKNQDYNEMQSHWQMYPQSRYSIFLRNTYELPVQDAVVELIDDAGKVLWTARTDNAGRAELWGDLTTRDKSLGRVHARVKAGKTTQTIKDLKSVDVGVNHIDISADCYTTPQVDIFFAVDATGSMGDEIAYLQEELKDVIERSLAANKVLDVRLGSVFYRDTTDNYLAQSQPLSADAQKTIDFIAKQRASGGGDYPEAVDAALDIALTQDWSEQAIARIVFLLLDAPPHHNPEVLSNLKSQIKEAAELGIKIIPITASGINRQTEFLMKFMAIATNGTYVFITDHSGIGNPHLDPVVQDYEVEKLNDLMVRLLYNYTKSNGCQDNQQVEKSVKLYPNPAKDFVTVSSETPLKSIKILSNTGMIMGTKTNLEKGETRLDVSGLVDGMYTIHCVGEEREFTQPLVVINR